jgi:hypothetical protein
MGETARVSGRAVQADKSFREWNTRKGRTKYLTAAGTTGDA